MQEKEKEKQTAGELALELQQKTDEKINPIEMQREFHKGKTSDDSYENQLKLCIERGKKEYEGDFFITMLLKKERLLQNIIRAYFYPRKTCPTPDYDQTVYRYLRKEDVLEYLWTIPDKNACHLFLSNKDMIVEEQQWLLSMLKDFYAGKLLQLAKKLNNEI